MSFSFILFKVFHAGLVGPGEEIRLVREPHNPYDRREQSLQFITCLLTLVYSNAIQVKNIGQTQIGHIPRSVAAKLAPLIDRGLIIVEGVMHEGNRK